MIVRGIDNDLPPDTLQGTLLDWVSDPWKLTVFQRSKNMHTVFSRREWACLKEGNRESALGVEYWKIMFFGRRKIILTRKSQKDCRRN